MDEFSCHVNPHSGGALKILFWKTMGWFGVVCQAVAICAPGKKTDYIGSSELFVLGTVNGFL